MKLAIEKGGHVIIDDQTGKIVHVLVPKLHMGKFCLLYTSPSPRDGLLSRMPSSA